MNIKRFVCGTRAVKQLGPSDYRIVCATCDGGGTVPYRTQQEANRGAVRDSAKRCPVKCGAR